MTTRLPVDKLVQTLNDLFGKFDDAAEVSSLVTSKANESKTNDAKPNTNRKEPQRCFYQHHYYVLPKSFT